MFTGLIEAVCEVTDVRRSAGNMTLVVNLDKLADGCRISDSFAINGVCLTVARLDGKNGSFDLSSETLAKSTLGKLKPALKVNVERAIRAADRFGGHFVQGHIDGTAVIKAVDRQGEFADIRFAAGPDLLEQMAVKGSVAVDGISLTVTQLDKNSFTAAMIPHTLEKTTLGEAKIGDEVNIETDIIVKTIKAQLKKLLPQQEKLTVEKLKQLGF